MKDRIYQIMKESGMNQKEFSIATGIPTATLSNIFNGRTSATLNHALALHKRFPTLKMEWLMFGEGDMYSSDHVQESENLSGSLFSQAENQDEVHPNSHTDSFSSSETNPTAKGAEEFEFPTKEQNQLNETIKQVVKYINKPARKIVEVRVFFDDGTYEVFSKLL